MQTRLPVHRPQLLLMPQPSDPQVRPLQVGTQPAGGGGGFGSLSFSLSGFFFFFLRLRLALVSWLVVSHDPSAARNPAAATRVASRREREAPSARARRSNCASSTPRHPGRHPRSSASRPGAQARNHARDEANSRVGSCFSARKQDKRAPRPPRVLVSAGSGREPSRACADPSADAHRWPGGCGAPCHGRAGHWCAGVAACRGSFRPHACGCASALR